MKAEEILNSKIGGLSVRGGETYTAAIVEAMQEYAHQYHQSQLSEVKGKS